MIRIVRYPEKVTVEDGKDRHMDWFEVYGETEPVLSSGTGKPVADGGLYEYRWALGYSEGKFSESWGKLGSEELFSEARDKVGLSQRKGLRRRDDDSKHPPRLSDKAAARVSFYFPAGCNWRVSEILATVKHLSPVEQERNWREEFAKDFTAIEPVIGAAGKAAAVATGMPELGSVAEAVSRLKLTSVPQAAGTMWFVRKVDRVESGSLFFGIEWQLSLGLLKQLGSRVTGGLLVSFASVQPGATKGEMLAYAAMDYEPERAGNVWVPTKINNDPLKLCLEPKYPESKQLEAQQAVEARIKDQGAPNNGS